MRKNRVTQVFHVIYIKFIYRDNLINLGEFVYLLASVHLINL